MRSSTAIPSPQGFDPALRGACEKSARSVMSVLRREAPAGTSPEILMDFAASLTGVIERTTVMLLAGKQVRVIEDDEAITTQEAADLLNVVHTWSNCLTGVKSRPYPKWAAIVVLLVPAC